MQTKAFKDFIRTKYVFPGGYSLHMICADGGLLCHQCALDNTRLIIRATRNPDTDNQWEFTDVDINWEDDGLYCDNCNNTIEPQYS